MHGDDDGLRAQLAEARAAVSALVQAVLNPNLNRSDLMLAAAVYGESQHKQTTGQVRADGRVVLSAADIANDHRKVPEPGERVAETNRDGSLPRMARSQVKAAIGKASERGLLAVRPVEVRRVNANGCTYKDTEWVVEPAPNAAEAYAKWASYRPENPVRRKPRTVTPPCPHCGEVHPIRRQDACLGCGAMFAPRIIDPVLIEAEPETDPTSNDLSRVGNVLGTVSPDPRVTTVEERIRGERVAAPAPPAWLADAPDVDADVAPDNLSPVAPPAPEPTPPTPPARSGSLPGFNLTPIGTAGLPRPIALPRGMRA